MNRINIFIPAAGLGERLRPVTDHIPKPLVPVLGRPVLQYVLDEVTRLAYGKIGINTHYKKNIIEESVSRSSMSSSITLFHEEAILGTGGALKNAEGFLGGAAFLVHNSDILSDINLERLLEYHRSSGNLVTLAVHDHPKFNSLVLDEKGFLQRVEAGLEPGHAKAFTGIAVYEPGFLEFLPAGVSSVVDAWLKAVSSGERIGAFDVTGCYWNDIGTPSAYVSAVFHKLRAEGENVFVHGSVTKCSGADIEGNVVIEAGCELRPGVSLKNCIVLPGCAVGLNNKTGAHDIDDRTFYENCIVGPGFRIDLDEKDILNIDAEGKQLIGVGGSDRNYFRIRDRYRSSVLMQCRGDDPDFERHIEYAHFFMRHGVPVPGLISVEAGRKSAVFEDAGDMLLYSWLKCPGGVEDIEDIYRKVMDIMALFHSTATEHVYECPPLQERVFDLKYFRWETEYFCERFVEGSRGVRYKDKPALDNELDALAAKAFSFPKTVMHRDFQSQNIMVMKGRRLRVIDYQGARIGPPGYDAASMLWDPYYRIEDRMRDRLIGHYISLMRERTGNGFEALRFMESLTVCRLQRHMQALGAYGFLSSIKRKKYFLKHIPGALRLLKEDISLCAGEYPVLHELIMGL